MLAKSKIIHHYLSSIENEKAWKNTSPEGHFKLIRMFARNDIPEQAFVKMTYNYSTFNMILGRNVIVKVQVRTSGN